MCLHCKNVSALQKGRRPQDTLVSKNVSESQKERRPQIYFSVQNLERESEFERGRKKFKINGVLLNTPLIALLYSECTLIKMLFRIRTDRYFTSFLSGFKFALTLLTIVLSLTYLTASYSLSNYCSTSTLMDLVTSPLANKVVVFLNFTSFAF